MVAGDKAINRSNRLRCQNIRHTAAVPHHPQTYHEDQKHISTERRDGITTDDLNFPSKSIYEEERGDGSVPHWGELEHIVLTREELEVSART